MSIMHLPLAGDTLSSIVAANVRAEAARRGYSQTTLAAALGLGRVSVSERWRGVTEWRLDDLQRCAEVLHIDVADLLRARRDSNPQPADP